MVVKSPPYIAELINSAQTREMFRGYLAEQYDGIGQYVLVTLSRGSTSAAMPARIASGDFNLHRIFPVGTPVVVFSNRGLLEVLSLGGAGGEYAYHREGTLGSAQGVPRLPTWLFLDDNGIISEAVVGGHLVRNGYNGYLVGIPSAEAFGTPALIGVIAYLIPGGIVSAEAFGSPKLTWPGSIGATGIASATAFGTYILRTGGVLVLPSGIATGESLGALVLLRGGGLIVVTGIAGASALGVPILVTAARIIPTGLSSTEAFGTHILRPGSVQILSSGIATAAQLGAITIQTRTSVVPAGISSLATLGTLQLKSMNSLAPAGIASSENLGTPTLVRQTYAFQSNAFQNNSFQ